MHTLKRECVHLAPLYVIGQHVYWSQSMESCEALWTLFCSCVPQVCTCMNTSVGMQCRSKDSSHSWRSHLYRNISLIVSTELLLKSRKDDVSTYWSSNVKLACDTTPWQFSHHWMDKTKIHAGLKRFQIAKYKAFHECTWQAHCECEHECFIFL